MDFLKDKKQMKNKISVFIPSTININNLSDKQDYFVELFLLKMGELFGGATCVVLEGVWISESIGIVKENVKNVYAYFEILCEFKIKEILKIVEDMKEEMAQEKVGIEINNVFYLI